MRTTEMILVVAVLGTTLVSALTETSATSSTTTTTLPSTIIKVSNGSNLESNLKLNSTVITTTAASQSETVPSSTFKPSWKWTTVTSGEQNSLPYSLNCSLDWMTIEINLTTLADQQPFIYLEKLRSFDICRPKIVKSIATFHLALDDNFYRCGTTKVYDHVTGSRVYYNRVIVESKKTGAQHSVYFKCSQPSLQRLLKLRKAEENQARNKRQILEDGTGQLVNFTEIELPDNFMEAEILDLDNITARAPYPHLNLKVKRNGQIVNTSLNVAPGTPLEMIIYLDDESKSVYGLLASFLKVTDANNKQQEAIVLNGCSIDPYIFGNFESEDHGDSISAKFRAFKFPESNYVMFIGTVNVCLDQCKGVPCGNGVYALGRRRRRRSILDELPKDPNKMFEIEMSAYLQIGYSEAELKARKDALEGTYIEESPKAAHLTSEQLSYAESLTSGSETFVPTLLTIFTLALHSLIQGH